MKKKKIILIIFIAFFVLAPFISSNNLNSNLVNGEEKEQDNNKNSNSNTIKNHIRDLKTSKSWHNFTFIHITGANWSIAAGYDWVNGSGTFNDPYVIENITIDAGGSAGGILIENSDVFFRIENCTIYNSVTTGINLVNVTNGNLINNTVNYNNIGIQLEENSYNNTISRNTANYNNYQGISIYLYCDNNNVTQNTANYNEYCGIGVLYESNNNIISQNTANYNNYQGILVLYFSDNNNITQNTANYNEGHGITLNGRCDYNIVSENTANDNNNDGINVLATCYNNTISGNVANNNVNGIYLWSNSNNTVSGNTLVGNVYFIVEVDCIDNNIKKDNIFYTVILSAGTMGFEIDPYRVEDIDVNITIALTDETEVFFSGFYNNILDVPFDNGLIFMNLHLNDTDNLNQDIDAPINITLKYDVSKFKAIKTFWFNESANEGDGAWEEINFIDLGNGLLVISVNHTSIFALSGNIITFSFPISNGIGGDGDVTINIFLILIIAIICTISSITASSTYYYKTRNKRSKTRAKTSKKETLNKKALVKSYDERLVRSRNLNDYVEKENILRVLKEKNALEKPALFHDLKFNAVSNDFWEKLDKLELNEEDFNDFLNDMLSLPPEERQGIIDGMLEL